MIKRQISQYQQIGKNIIILFLLQSYKVLPIKQISSNFLHIFSIKQFNKQNSKMAMLRRINSKMEDLKDSRYFQNDHKQQYKPINQQWMQIKVSSNIISKRTHHASAVVQDKIYICGGYEADGKGILNDLKYFNLQTKQWHSIQLKHSNLGSRHSHSMIAYQEKLIVFGGIINAFQSTNKVYTFDVKQNNSWKQQKCTGQIPPPLNSHKAVLYQDEMFIFGGEQQQKYNQFLYSLNLQTKQWKIVSSFTKFDLTPRSDCSMTINQDKIYIFGGKKDDIKYNELWQYDIIKKQFKMLKNDTYVKPCPRSGHSSCIFKDNLIVFGGTTGITHQRNDMIIYNIKKNYWYNHWADQLTQKNQNQQQSILQKPFKKSRSNSAIKRPQCSGFNINNILTGNSKCKQKNQNQSQQIQQSNLNKSSRNKYRQKMKNQNYYNQNYPFYGDKQSLLGNKHKKNDLLVDLEKQSKEDFKHHRGLGSKNGNKIQLHLSQTFQSLNNSILSCLIQNGAKNDNVMSNLQQKLSKSTSLKRPKPRDGHSAQIYKNKMIIFGGDRHHISYNDIICVNLDKIFNGQLKSIGQIQLSI